MFLILKVLNVVIKIPLGMHSKLFFLECSSGIWIFYQHDFWGTVCIQSARRGQERVTNSLELELEYIVSHHMGVEK